MRKDFNKVKVLSIVDDLSYNRALVFNVIHINYPRRALFCHMFVRATVPVLAECRPQEEIPFHSLGKNTAHIY